MNAVLRRWNRLQPMTRAHLDEVMAIEVEAYPFPWTRGNFIDSLASGYPARVLFDGGRRDRIIGYFVAMEGVDELHLLNLTVAPSEQGSGHGRAMLDALLSMCRELHSPQLWLEVRVSNLRPREIYRRYGFREVGVRRAYYPAADGLREDACVMSLDLTGGPL